ncbi:hypothetical protein LX87_00344 [Larkinella arboricola]|uniref:Uncharacterized protein n=1 Tax=Larkinella arboricola TaxID=643671 RepID=A0A327X802_LARAB|nr:hypothetical protein [Larkinella arboricola]RAK02224.1 hypothetical protein LX87_00344 [Larkinella arboricola]
MKQQQRKDFIRLMSLFLTGLLLLVASGGPSWLSVEQLSEKQTVQAPKNEKKAGDTKEATVQATSFDAVVTPAHTFGFSQTVYLLPPPVLFFELKQTVIPRFFEIPYFYFSFLCYVFGHHIAINAP